MPHASFAYRTQVWVVEKTVVIRTVPSAEVDRLKRQVLAEEVGTGNSCDYGGLYDITFGLTLLRTHILVLPP